MATTVRTTTLAVFVRHAGDTTWTQHAGAYAATCSFGFDQRTAEAEVHLTVAAGAPTVTYWDEIRVDMGCTPGHGVATRFEGYLVPLDSGMYPLSGVLHCRGKLYKAAWWRETTVNGKDMSAGGVGRADELQVIDVLVRCGVPYTAANIGGTGKALGSVITVGGGDPLTPGPFTWGQGESGLAYIERLDEASVPDSAAGRYRTFESLAGDVYRIPLSTTPTATPDFTFTEGVDVLEAAIVRDPDGAGNRVTVLGAPLNISTAPGIINAMTFTASTPTAPYLPPGLPTEADGHAYVATSFTSPMLEKSNTSGGPNVLSCEAVATFLLGEANCVLDTLTFSTPRDDLLGPGQTIHLDSPRLGITDPAQHYWLQRLEITYDERGQFTQRLTCIRKS